MSAFLPSEYVPQNSRAFMSSYMNFSYTTQTEIILVMTNSFGNTLISPLHKNSSWYSETKWS